MADVTYTPDRRGIAQLLTSGAALAFGENAHDAALDQIVQSLVVLQSGEHPLLPARLATDTLLQAVGMLWENNWQPLDLAHIVRRHQGSRGAALAVAVIMEQAGREHATDRARSERRRPKRHRSRLSHRLRGLAGHPMAGGTRHPAVGRLARHPPAHRPAAAIALSDAARSAALAMGRNPGCEPDNTRPPGQAGARRAARPARPS